MRVERFSLEGVGDWEVLVPPTVYPPREDSELLCKAISRLSRHNGNAVEIGCGSGVVSVLLASLGWNVTSFDVNPFAVSATRGNLERYGFSSSRVEEAGVGEGMEIPEGTDLVVWNIPYLDREEHNGAFIGQMEEAALSDIDNGGWGGALLSLISENPSSISSDLLVLLVLRTDPVSCSNISDWKNRGWSCRSLNFVRMGEERIEVFGFWRTGSGENPTILETCKSTMEEAEKFESGGWKRVFSNSQTAGRGRKGSKWSSNKGGLFATWNLDEVLLRTISAGLLQTSIGAIVSKELNAKMKWPNDIMHPDGRKMGGVLVESSEGRPIRVGVGANMQGFEDKGVIGSGWEETLGKIGANEVFKRLDCSISSFFENTADLPMPSTESLVAMSWEALAGFLSEGAMVQVNGEIMRPVGLSIEGEIEALGTNGQEVVRDLDGTEWVL